MEFEIKIPVYYTISYKSKPDKTILLSLNWERNAHYYIKNTVKQDMTAIIANLIPNKDYDIDKYKVKYTYNYKSEVSDLLNVGAMTSKYFLDTIQQLDIVTNDNVKYCINEEFIVGTKNREDPHMLVSLYKEK